MKVNVSIDEELLKRMDKYADENFMSRSGLISLAVTQYLNQFDIINAWKEVAICMRTIADKGTVDHETMEQLEDFERLARMFVGATKPIN